jgi:hypothetical protein
VLAKTSSTDYATGWSTPPTSLPPSGPVPAGDLAGSTYPSPVLAAGAVTDAKIADVAATKLTGTIAQARLPVAPTGIATANVNDAAITDAKIAGVAYAKVTGAPTALPPSGGASGSLAGSYPAPSIAASAVRGTPSSGGTAREIAKASIWGADDLIDASVSDAKIAAVGAGKLTGTIAAARLPVAPTGVDTANVNDAAITNVKVASGLDAAKVTAGVLPVAQVPNLDAGQTTTGTFALARIPVLDVTKLPDAPAGITTGKLNDGAVTRAKIAADAWLSPVPLAGDVGKVLQVATGPALVWQTPGAASIPDGSITTAKLADAPSGVTTAKLNDLAVTDAKIAGVAYAKVTGAPTALPPSGAAGGDLAGSTYPNPTVIPAVKSKWTLTGTTLIPVATVKELQLSAAGDAAFLGYTYEGQPTLKGFSAKGSAAAQAPLTQYMNLLALQGAGCYQAGNNYSTQASFFFYASEAWSATARGSAARLDVTPAGTTTLGGHQFAFDADGAYRMTGSYAQKASGTTWSNPSDRRLKDEIADYPTGLAAVVQLQPRSFVYNGKGGSTAGARGFGFIADEVATAMPEMVGTYHYVREGAADTETEYATVDQSNLILALVNAVRELDARLARLEAPA